MLPLRPTCIYEKPNNSILGEEDNGETKIILVLSSQLEDTNFSAICSTFKLLRKPFKANSEILPRKFFVYEGET